MPKIERTERGVTTRASYQPFDTSRGDPVGAGLKNLGASISSLGAVNDEQEMFDAKMAVSDYTFRKTRELDERVASYNPAQHGPAEEFDRSYLAEREQQDQQFIGQFRGRKSQQYAALAVQENRQRAALAAQNARQGFVMNGNIEKIESLSAQIGSTITGDPSSVATGLKAIDGAIDAVPNLTQRQRQILRRHAADAAWKNWLGRATPEEMRKAVQDYEAGHDAWRQKFNDIGGDGEDATGPLTSGKALGKPAGWAATDRTWQGLSQYEKAAAMALMEADGRNTTDAKNALGAMINRAAKGGEDLGAHVSRSIYQPTIEASQHARLASIVGSKEHRELTEWAQRRAAGKEADPVKGATHFLASERTMLALEAREPSKYRSWRQWTGFNGKEYSGVITRDGSHAFLAPEGAREERRAEGRMQYLSGSPDDETGNGTKVERQKIAQLPDRANMGDHAINEFTGLVPAIKKKIAEADAEAEATRYFNGVIAGEIPFNAQDAEGRKFIDQKVGQTNIGQRIFNGDPQALLGAASISDRISYVPKPIYDAFKGLIDSKDAAAVQRGYDAVLNLYDRNPNIFNTHGDEKSLLADAEYYRRLRRTMEPDKAIELMREEKLPGNKLVKSATKDSVDKFMKGYEGDAAASQVAMDLDEGFSTLAWGWLGGQARTDADYRTKSAIIADYRDVLRREYEATGNETKAKATAASFMRRRYGVSNVMGSEQIMPYPPERFYPKGPDGTHDYIKKEVDEMVGTYSPSAKPGTARLFPLESRHWVDGKPSYGIRVDRADGREEVLPGRFVPSAPGVKEEFDKERAKAIPKPATGEAAPPADNRIFGGKSVNDLSKDAVDAVKGVFKSEGDRARAEKAQGVDASQEILRNPGQRRRNPAAPLTIER